MQIWLSGHLIAMPWEKELNSPELQSFSGQTKFGTPLGLCGQQSFPRQLDVQGLQEVT